MEEGPQPNLLPAATAETQLYLLNDWVLKLLGTPPLPDTGQAVCVIAAGENAKPPLRSRRLLEDHFHADTAHFVLTGLEGKGLLHLVFECRHAHLQERGGNPEVLGCWEQLPASLPPPGSGRNMDHGSLGEAQQSLESGHKSLADHRKDFKPSLAQPPASPPAES